MKRNVLNSPGLLELKKRRHKVFLKKILILLLGVIVIFLSLAYLSHLNKLNISEIDIVGNKVLDTETLKIAVKEQITGKYLWLFPKTNIFLYPQNTIKNELQNEFKRIKDISLLIKNTKTLQISLTERVALYTWCGENFSGVGIPQGSPTPEKENKCYFVDEDGYVFDEAPYFSGNIYFKFYGAQSESYFSKQNFKQLISFRDVLVGMGLKPVALYVTDDGDIQIFLSSMNSSRAEPKIILKADADFQNVAENLQAALDTEPLKSKFKNKYSTLEYIDLRFGNKVYDKFQ
jgi:cell division septal protein FtsQ